MADKWIRAYDDGVLTVIDNLNGIDWMEAPVPRRLHRCKPQTRTFSPKYGWIYRCACGSMREGNSRYWSFRNQTRNHKRKFNKRDA